MNKIYNNLSIENLMKTEKFNQFDKNQIEQIKLGLNNYVDISIYAKKEFDWQKMYVIRKGLEKGIDVSVYVKPEFNAGQMDQIRLGLFNSLKKCRRM